MKVTMRWTKTMGWTGVLALMLTWSVAACSDDSGSGVDVHKTCSDVCAKQVSCNASDDQASCEADCGNMLPKMNDGFVTASADCIMGHSCTELDNDVCDGAGREYCTTDIRPLMETVCAHQVNCNGGTQSDIDNCITQQLSSDGNDMFKCFKPATLSDLGNCLDGLACDASQDEFNACVESSLGVNIVSEQSPGNQ